MFNLFKLFTYTQDTSNLQSQLIELQQAYKDLSTEKDRVSNRKSEILDLLDSAYLHINELESKVNKLETANKDLDTYNTTLQTNFSKQEEFISKLKTCSDNLNNLFFEDENRRY